MSARRLQRRGPARRGGAVGVAERDEAAASADAFSGREGDARDELIVEATAPPRPPPKARRTAAPRRGCGASVGRRIPSSSCVSILAPCTSLESTSAPNSPAAAVAVVVEERRELAHLAERTRRRLFTTTAARQGGLEGAPMAGGACQPPRRASSAASPADSGAGNRWPASARSASRAAPKVWVRRSTSVTWRETQSARVASASTLGCRGGARDSASARPK